MNTNSSKAEDDEAEANHQDYEEQEAEELKALGDIEL